MAEISDTPITITAYDWVPDFAKGQVRDLRVRWALEEAGLDYSTRYLPQGQQKEPAHRRIQPFGQIPTYEEGGLALFESGAIVLHIAERAPDALLPDGRDHAAQWVFAALNTVEPNLSDWAVATLFEADKPWSAPRLPSIRERIDERLGELAAHLGTADWLGSAFGAGDLMMVTVLHMMDGDLHAPLAQHENLLAYRERGRSRPAFGRAMEAQMAGFTGRPPPGFS